MCVVLRPHSKGLLMLPELKREVTVGDTCGHSNVAT